MESTGREWLTIAIIRWSNIKLQIFLLQIEARENEFCSGKNTIGMKEHLHQHQKRPFRRCSSKKVFLKILQISQEILVLESLFNKVAGHKAGNFIKKRLQHRCFPVKFVKILRLPF